MISILIITFFINFGILNIGLINNGYPSTFTLWNITDSDSVSQGLRIYAIFLKITFYVSLAALLLPIIGIVKKNSATFVSSIIYFILFDIAVIIFHGLYHCLSIASLALCILNLLLVSCCFVLLFFRKNALEKSEADETNINKNISVQQNAKAKKVGFGLLLTDIFSIFFLVILFFVPLYTFSSNGITTTNICILFLSIFGEDVQIENVVYFLLFLLLCLTSFVIFTSLVSLYYSDKNKFVKNSKSYVFFNFGVALAFFGLGFAIDFYYSIHGHEVTNYSYIPAILEIGAILASSILKGKYDCVASIVEEDPIKKFPKIEPLIYLVLLSLVNYLSLFLNYIKITFTSLGYNSNIEFTGIKLLSDYSSLGSAYQLMALFVFIMLVVTTIGLILCISSYFSKYKYFKTMVKYFAYTNIMFMFLFGISGFYFTIAQALNADNIASLISYYNVSYSETYTYNASTDTFYALLVDIVILIVMIKRKAMDENLLFESEGGSNNKEEKSTKPTLNETSSDTNLFDDKKNNFDPCPAFSAIDAKDNLFREDINQRKLLLPNEYSLNGLVNFIVEYAKDSRLHLSYTKETIATFVAGLGISRLSILQGMSGTGKTSLPKIFAEAIDANCDIVEVESSWKDKNELLGYYNEFSMKYTPKKFTQDLYKATLNPEIPTFIVLDEMNLSRIEYYFSDFLSLMENEENRRELKLTNVNLFSYKDSKPNAYLSLKDGNTIAISPNIWFIGTANRDESTFVISDKVYDRANTMDFNHRAKKIRDFSQPIPRKFYSYEMLNTLLNDAKKNGYFDAENNEAIKKVEEILQPYNISFGNRVLNQIEDFVKIYQKCFPDMDVTQNAIDIILLSKVVRKLETKTIDNKEELIYQFKMLNLPRCTSFIESLSED